MGMGRRDLVKSILLIEVIILCGAAPFGLLADSYITSDICVGLDTVAEGHVIASHPPRKGDYHVYLNGTDIVLSREADPQYDGWYDFKTNITGIYSLCYVEVKP